jgi:hypothetical protein
VAKKRKIKRNTRKVENIRKEDNFLKYFWQLTVEYWEEAIAEFICSLLVGFIAAQLASEFTVAAFTYSSAGILGILVFAIDLVYWSFNESGMFYSFFEKIERTL